jgi:hypothetical protein
VRNAANGYTQLSEIKIADENENPFVWPSISTCYDTTEHVNTGTYGSGIELPSNLIDGNVNTKMCRLLPLVDGERVVDACVYIDLGTEILDISKFNRWCWYTANDAADRDPTTFTLSVSNDATNWTIVDS